MSFNDPFNPQARCDAVLNEIKKWHQKATVLNRLLEFLGIGVATFWRWAKERHDFPKMIRLSARCTVVDGEQLVAWRDAQAAKVA